MSNLYFQKLRERIPITLQEEDIIKGLVSFKKFRKKQYLLQAGDVCKSLAFVEQGALRAYSIDEKGQEHIIQFALEGWTISDLYSFIADEPSIYNIDALEDTEVVIITKNAWDEIQRQVPQYEAYTRRELIGAYASMQKRITALISLSPDEKYTYFTNLYPNVVQRVPQHMIASFLGLTPETLSRVRKRLFAAK